MNKEIWKDIDLTKFGGEDYTGLYQVSNFGNVKALKRKVWNRFKYIQKDEFFLKKNNSSWGYLLVKLSKNKIRKGYSIHRLVGMIFIDNPDNLPEINHLDGNKHNNVWWNLEWCNCSQNQLHAFKTGLKNYKGENHLHKLREKDVLRIREIVKNFKDSKLKLLLAKEYEVSVCTINDILKRRNWTHI